MFLTPTLLTKTTSVLIASDTNASSSQARHYTQLHMTNSYLYQCLNSIVEVDISATWLFNGNFPPAITDRILSNSRI